MGSETDTIVISATGLNCSLGAMATAACAAARAGITRARELPIAGYDPTLGKMVPLKGHQAAMTARGAQGAARLTELAVPAIRDVMNNAKLPFEQLAAIPLLLLVSDRFLIQCAEAVRDSSGHLPDKIEPSEFEQTVASLVYGKLLSILGNRLGIRLHPASQLIFGDHTDTADAIVLAEQILAEHGLPRCLVGAVDSLIEQDAINALLHLNLALAPDNPDGIMPGEAAAFLLIENQQQNDSLGSSKPVSIQATAIAFDEGHRFGKAPCIGRGLREAVAQTIQNAGSEVSIEHVYVDYNGDSWKANEWGNVVSSAHCADNVRTAAYQFPCVSFGDTGCVATIASICLAAHCLNRENASMNSVLIAASSYRGKKLAMLLQRANPSESQSNG